EIFFRNVEGLGRRGSGGGLHSTYELFVLVGIRQLRVWAQESVNQFALLLLGIAHRRQGNKGEGEQAEPHRFRLQNPARFVKKKTHAAFSQRDQPDQHQYLFHSTPNSLTFRVRAVSSRRWTCSFATIRRSCARPYVSPPRPRPVTKCRSAR